MGKKIYVNGGILVNTPYFTYKNVTCLCDKIPEGAEIIDPPLYEGTKCLVIDDDYPHSPFNEYFCKTFFTSLYVGVGTIIDPGEECYEEFSEGIEEARKLLSIKLPQNNDIQWPFYKMVFLHAISCLDSFICSLVLSKIRHDEKLLIDYYKKMLSNQKKANLLDDLVVGDRKKWERNVIEEVLHTSFCKIDTIKDCFKCLNASTPKDNTELMNEHFRTRHILIHRNGKLIDGDKIALDYDCVSSAIDDVYNYGCYLLHCFQTPRQKQKEQTL